MTRKIRNAMLRALHSDECVEHGEVNCTRLAETAAHELGHDEWLDDHTHEVWDIAVDVAERWENEHERSNRR